MFAESRSAKLKVNLYQPQKAPKSLIDYEFRVSAKYQLKIAQWELLLYRALIFGCGFSLGDKSRGIKKLIKAFSYGLFFWLAMARYPIAVFAQSIEPLPPDRPRPPQPQPLPPNSNPLNELNAPPLPESVLDIPGTIVVKKFQFAGSTVFNQAELQAAIAAFTDKPISFAQLVQAANAITQLYVKKGYITSGAYVPEQNLSSGIVQIQVVEGSLADIEVDILKGRLSESYIRDRLTSKIATPLNINKLQEALQLLQLNPLIESLNAELSAGIKPGTNSLTVSVTGADTFGVQIWLNNNRNPSIGTFERGITLEEANLFGIGDRFFVGYNNTEGSNEYRGSYALPINARDGFLRFDVRLGYNQIVESPFDEADIDTNFNEYDLTWRQPVFQKANAQVSQELALNFTVSKQESQTTILDVPQGISPGADSKGRINTSALSFGQEWLQRNRQQVIAARSEFTLGVDALGATIKAEEPDGQFFSWRGQLSYLRLLSTPKGNPAIGSTILLRSELQLGADPLVSTEQFSLGGAATVRGYGQDALLTDNGFSASAELRLPIARLSKVGATLQFSPFIDFGTGWNTDGEQTEFNTLLGTGFGLILQTEDRLLTRIDWGIPLLNQAVEGSTLQEDGVYLQLEYKLF